MVEIPFLADPNNAYGGGQWERVGLRPAVYIALILSIAIASLGGLIYFNWDAIEKTLSNL